MTRTPVIGLAIALALVACGGDGAPPPETTGAPTIPTAGVSPDPGTGSAATSAPTTPREQPADACAHVVDVSVERSGDGLYRFDVTVSSADTGWEKYADAWEVRGPEGDVLGTRELAHPHDNEQPFTRSLSGVDIPVDVTEVTVAARDSVAGFCGETMTVAIG